MTAPTRVRAGTEVPDLAYGPRRVGLSSVTARRVFPDNGREVGFSVTYRYLQRNLGYALVIR